MRKKYSQKRLDKATKTTTDAVKTASEKAIKKTAEATGDLIGNKIADKITKKSSDNNLKKLKIKQKYTRKIYISRKKTKNY